MSAVEDGWPKLADHTPEQMREIFCRPSWPTTPVADPAGRHGVYVLVFSAPADGVGLPVDPAFESAAWRELARLIPTPNTYDRWLAGTVLDQRWDVAAEDVAAVLAEVPPVLLVELYSPVAVIPAGRLASRLVLMTDEATRGAAVDWCRQVIRDDPTPGAWLVK